MQKNKRKPAKKPGKRKNVSKTIQNGQTMQTRDEFLESGRGKKNIKPKHPNQNDLYRRVVVVGSNRNDELMVVKLTTKGKNRLPKYQNGKSTYKPFIETHDNRGNFIKPDGRRFKMNKSKANVSTPDVNKISKKVFKDSAPKTTKRNRNLARELKGRKNRLN